MRLLTYLNQDQMRLGYLNCLALVAGRQLDSHASLLRRFEDFIFRKIHLEDLDYHQGNLLVGEKKPTQGRMRPTDGSPGKGRLPKQMATDLPIHYLHGMWLNQPEVGDATGIIVRSRCAQILKMARDMGLIGPSYALTELGVLVQGILLDMDREFPNGRLDLNPFHIWKRPILALSNLFIVLSADILMPFLVEIYSLQPLASERKNVKNSASSVRKKRAPSPRQYMNEAPERQVNDLVKAIDHLIGVLNKELPIDQTLVLKEIQGLRQRLVSQTESSLENQFRPRRQYLVDLGLLQRIPGVADHEQPFSPVLATQRAVNAWRDLRNSPLKQHVLIQRNFFRWSAEIYGFLARPAENDLRRLDYFARGFPLVGREIGFTPARTVALAGCLLAIEEGVIIEVDEMFRMMSEMAKGPYRPYLHYSGGSRLDREFLIRVDVEPLRERLRREGGKPRITGGPRK